MSFLQQGALSAAMCDMADNPLRCSACVFTDLETQILKSGNTTQRSSWKEVVLFLGKKK